MREGSLGAGSCSQQLGLAFSFLPLPFSSLIPTPQSLSHTLFSWIADWKVLQGRMGLKESLLPFLYVIEKPLLPNPSIVGVWGGNWARHCVNEREAVLGKEHCQQSRSAKYKKGQQQRGSWCISFPPSLRTHAVGYITTIACSIQPKLCSFYTVPLPSSFSNPSTFLLPLLAPAFVNNSESKTLQPAPWKTKSWEAGAQRIRWAGQGLCLK